MPNKKINSDLCEICGESRNPATARFEHRRLGLDEPPEPVLCRCRNQDEIFTSIMHKVQSVTAVTTIMENMTIDSLAYPSPNMVMIEAMSPTAVREVEVRLNQNLSEVMFMKMRDGLFTDTTTREIREMGCMWWTGPETNINAKVRVRSNGEAVVKVSRSAITVAPGYVLGVSDEYGFDGMVKDPTYDVDMTELKSTIVVRATSKNSDVRVNVMARMYTSTTRVSYAAEYELVDEVSSEVIRRVMAMSGNIVGHVPMMRGIVDSGFMSAIRSRDHIVVDTPSLYGYKGRLMAKADGVKVYVFCYEFGYVMALTDPDMTVISCMVAIEDTCLPAMTDKPDVVVGDMLVDGSVVYFTTLAANGTVNTAAYANSDVCSITTKRPTLIYRTSWDVMPTEINLKYEPTPSDGVVLVNEFRTMRLKQPTVDLIYLDGKLCTSDNGVMVPVANGNPNMEENMIYEMDVVKDELGDGVVIINPRDRVAKKVPNSMEVVKRAIASTRKDPLVDAALLDLTSMSFSMRERVYTMAQAKASKTKKVIVTFGVGRFQEWRQMMVDNMSYIAIDPEIDTTMLTKKVKGVSVYPYDFNKSFKVQITSIAKTRPTVLWAKCRSEYFIDKVMPSRTMAMAGIPAVFSFSVSFHIPVINRLLTEGVTVFGCGFVHDSMPLLGVGSGCVTMKPKNKRRSSGSDIIATFGKSTYVEPYLSRSSIRGLFLVKDEMPSLWRSVDSNTVEIMERAVIMYAS